jgi:predicted RNase H-like HicB family nuclease
VKEYTVIIQQAGDNYSAYVPDLPGCIAAGDTIEETEQLIREAIELHIEGIHEDGEEIPEPTAKIIKISIAA